MKKEKNFYQIVDRICSQDRRYKADAYEFVLGALHFTQNKIKRPGHISGGELLEGIRDFAIEQYGPMAKTVLAHWGITKTQDFGNVVFNMVDKKILSKTDKDAIGDFNDVYNFEAVFGNVFENVVIS